MNPNINDYVNTYNEIEKDALIKKERVVRDAGNLFVKDGAIFQEHLVTLSNSFNLSEEEILRILGVKVNNINDYVNTYNEIVKEAERVVRDVGNLFVKDGAIDQEHLAILSNSFNLSEEEILRILRVKKRIKVSSKVFGIDLGTTYSSIAYVDENGKVYTVFNTEDNSPVTPSVVYFDPDNEPVVGNLAKSMLLENPDLVCSAIKRVMGFDYTFLANGKKYNPQTVSAYILNQLAADAFSILGEKVKDVVITCPAYFGDKEREATIAAGKIAGLNVLSILNEPTAAAIAYGLKVDEPQTVIVYDLGGGTFDVTVIKVSEGHIFVIATGGDHNLGGKDWDAKIRDYAIDQYVQLSGESKDEVMDDLEAVFNLQLKSEEVKRKLSKLLSYTVRFLGRNIVITREQFDNITEGLLNNTMDLMKETMDEAAKKGVTHYDKILLSGGSTYMPQVMKRLTEEFPDIPIVVIDPDIAVAKGAAIYGRNLTRPATYSFY